MMKWLALALALVPQTAQAASRVWIAEFSTGRVEAAAPFALLPTLLLQPTLDISTGVKTSAAFNAKTVYIRIVCEVQCAITAKGVATPAALLLPALKPEYFGVAGGSLSVIAAP